MVRILYILGLIVFTLKANVTLCQVKCDVLYDGIDLATKTYRVEMAPALIFNHTPPEVKNDLQTSNLIQCRGQIVQIQDNVSLHLNIQVNSLMAPKAYGSLDVGALLRVTLIDGKEVELRNYASSGGIPTEDKKAFIYPVAFELSNKAVKQLSKMEIDKIGIQWSSGYEEYVIYEVDFLTSQLSCLKHLKDQKPN